MIISRYISRDLQKTPLLSFIFSVLVFSVSINVAFISFVCECMLGWAIGLLASSSG